MKSEETKHSSIGASSMHRWSNCPGSVQLSRGIESVSSKYAEEGTLAHSYAAYFLEHQCFPPNESIDEEMADAILIYTNEVFKDKKSLDTSFHGNLFLIEHGFSLTSIHPDAFGTSDCVIYDVKKKKLIVYDYKHGAGLKVEVEDNEQLMYYALGALLSIDALVHTVELKIVQPRCPHDDGPIRSWTFDAFNLLEFQARLSKAIEATQKPNAFLSPGDWCRFCPANGICPELASKSLVIAQKMFAVPAEDAPPEEKLNYDKEKLAETLDKLPILEAFIEAVRSFAYGEATKGRTPPGYKLVQKRATRKWRSTDNTVDFLNDTLRKKPKELESCFTAPELKSPAQVEKVLGKSFKKQIEELVVAESSGYKLAHNSEPGEAILLDAKSIFGEIAEGDK